MFRWRSTCVPSRPADRSAAAGWRTEAPLTLTTEPPRTLGFLDQLAMWGNLGISLFGPITGALVATTTGSVGLALLAIVVGCAIGALLLGASALFGATTGAPAMVAMRGLLGRRGSVVPTLLNIGQNVGWATMEIIVISTAAVAVVGEAWRWVFVVGAGAVATLMAVRPLGSVRLLRKVMVWLVLAASVFLFVEVLARPRVGIPTDGVLGFWPGVDLAVAGVDLLRAARGRLQPALAQPARRVLQRLAGLRPRRGRLLRARASSPSPTSAPRTSSPRWSRCRPGPSPWPSCWWTRSTRPSRTSTPRR